MSAHHDEERERDALRNMIVEIHGYVAREAAALLSMYESGETGIVEDEQVKRDIAVLERFLADARKYVPLIAGLKEAP